MAKNDGQGSIIFKILILIFVAVLIAVILTPVSIWEEEDQMRTTSRGNLLSIYEAHRYFYLKNNRYTADNDSLIQFVQMDSSLKVKEKVVKYTQELKHSINDYLNSNAIDAVVKITRNISDIELDMINNENYFMMVDEIYEESENLKVKIASVKSGVANQDYAEMAAAIDSLLDLKRDLADFQLQTAARLAKNLAEHINNELPKIDFAAMEQTWLPIDQEITRFMKNVNSTELKQKTSVAERVKDFQDNVLAGFQKYRTGSLQSNLDDALQAAENLSLLYRTFLGDFLSTESYCQFRLTDTDSMLLHITTNNFTTPYDGLPYHVEFQDTLGLTVEDPTLLKEIKESAAPSVQLMGQLPFIPRFVEYSNLLDSLKAFGQEVKTAYRRNAEVHFAFKDLELKVDEIKGSTAMSSAMSLKSFAEVVPVTPSYSKISTLTDDALISIDIFSQIIESGIYGNYDSLHMDLVNQLTQFEELLSKIRKNEYTFMDQLSQLEDAHNSIKQAGNKDLLPRMLTIKTNLEELYITVSEGIDIPRYGVFSKRIENAGKVYGTGARRSWED